MKRLIGIAALTLIAVLTAGCGTQSPGAVSSALASSGVTLPTTCDEAFIAARDAGTATDEQLNAIVATCGSVEAIAQKAAHPTSQASSPSTISRLGCSRDARSSRNWRRRPSAGHDVRSVTRNRDRTVGSGWGWVVHEVHSDCRPWPASRAEGWTTWPRHPRRSRQRLTEFAPSNSLSDGAPWKRSTTSRRTPRAGTR